MPKLIPDAKKNILTTARRLLLEKGYSGLALRDVANLSSVALGTIYNYFPSKDMLVASVMAEDWHKSLINMNKACYEVMTIEEGIRIIYDSITDYIEIYKFVWNEYRGVTSGFGEHHKVLRNQLSNQLVEILKRFNNNEDEQLCPLITETILDCAMQNDIPYTVLSKMINRIFK
ncbi:MAG: TetR/AcrR family transcriptional regulator [Clostridiaceae bacterium]|jgi:AcrR family transcriptional regulator|nr:TetR/AcrR family transcriptional regulator [Clostridiaceae bacterium]